jgi:WhiB family redox-sensing transcriptional regulator
MSFDLELSHEPDEELMWQERALCAQTDPEAFFPEKGGSTREAKRVCLTCDVRGASSRNALSAASHPVWRRCSSVGVQTRYAFPPAPCQPGATPR